MSEGRTTEQLRSAIAAAADGKRVFYIVHTQAMAQYSVKLLREILGDKLPEGWSVNPAARRLRAPDGFVQIATTDQRGESSYGVHNCEVRFDHACEPNRDWLEAAERARVTTPNIKAQ